MATILIEDLNPAGYSLFADSESYLKDLSADDELGIAGGGTISTVTIVTTSSGACVVTSIVISASVVGTLAYTYYRKSQ